LTPKGVNRISLHQVFQMVYSGVDWPPNVVDALSSLKLSFPSILTI